MVRNRAVGEVEARGVMMMAAAVIGKQDWWRRWRTRVMVVSDK